MTRSFRRFAAVLLACFGFCLPASATIHSIDFTDIWYIPAENGWGINLIQQGDVLFGTLFVYGSDQTARWYVAPAMVPQSAPAGTYVFKSTLYQTGGPYFGTTPFDPTRVTLGEVGEATITFNSATSAQLVYNVGSVTVTKNIVRQTFRNDNPSGRYLGGMTALTSACANANNNNSPALIFGALFATVNGSQVSFRVDFVGNTGATSSCTFAGALSQQGKLATVGSGTWSCTTGNTGTFTMNSVDVQVNGMHATMVATDQFCTYNGRFGGLRDVIN